MAETDRERYGEKKPALGPGREGRMETATCWMLSERKEARMLRVSFPVPGVGTA